MPDLGFLSEISSVCRMKYSYSCFSFRFCFLVIVVLLLFMLSVQFLVAVINLSLLFFMESSCPRIDESTLSSMLACPRPSYLNTYSLSVSSLGCKDLCIVISFLVGSIYWSSSLVQFMKGSEYFTRGTLLVFIPFVEIPTAELDFEKFFRSSEILFFNFFFHLHLMVSASNIFKYVVSFLCSEGSDSFLIWQFYSLRYFFCFRLLAWHSFLCKIPFLYADCVFLLLV